MIEAHDCSTRALCKMVVYREYICNRLKRANHIQNLGSSSVFTSGLCHWVLQHPGAWASAIYFSMVLAFSFHHYAFPIFNRWVTDVLFYHMVLYVVTDHCLMDYECIHVSIHQIVFFFKLTSWYSPLSLLCLRLTS